MNDDLIREAFASLAEEISPSPVTERALVPLRARRQRRSRRTGTALVAAITALGFAATLLAAEPNANLASPALPPLAEGEASLPVDVLSADGASLRLRVSDHSLCSGPRFGSEGRIDVAESTDVVLIRAVGSFPHGSASEGMTVSCLTGADKPVATIVTVILSAPLEGRQVWFDPIDESFPLERWLQCASEAVSLQSPGPAHLTHLHGSADAALAQHLSRSDVDATVVQRASIDGAGVTFRFREQGRTIGVWRVEHQEGGWFFRGQSVCSGEWAHRHTPIGEAALEMCTMLERTSTGWSVPVDRWTVNGVAVVTAQHHFVVRGEQLALTLFTPSSGGGMGVRGGLAELWMAKTPDAADVDLGEPAYEDRPAHNLERLQDTVARGERRILDACRRLAETARAGGVGAPWDAAGW